MGMPNISEAIEDANGLAQSVRLAAISLADAKAAHERALSTLDTPGMLRAGMEMQDAGSAINNGLSEMVALVHRLDSRLNGDVQAVLRTAPQDHTSWDAFQQSNQQMVEAGPRYV